MSSVESAIASGRCSLAVSGSLMRDEEVLLALKEREGLSPMALAGGASGPVGDVSDKGLARAVGQPNGVLALVEPGPADEPTIGRIATMIGGSPHKPTIVVIGKSPNLFKLQMMFRGLKIEHRKERAQAFLKALPLPSKEQAGDAPELPKAERKKASDEGAPKFVFVGRDEERAQLAALLGDGGPIVVSGPRGIGRTALIEHAIVDSGLRRLPDLTLGRGVGFDALIARLAEITRAAGSSRLADLLAGPHTPGQLVEAAIAALQEASGTADQVFVVGNLQVATGRSGDFFRKSRLELLVEQLLVHTYPLRLVFVSLVQPAFFRERRDEHLRRLSLGGIKGRFLHEIFAAYHAPEFPRDKFGPISERLHGHPLAARTFAIASRDNEKLVDDDKFFKMSAVDDVEPIQKQLDKRLQKLDRPLRAMTVWLSHLRYPVDGQVLSDHLQISRKHRSQLLAEGVLDMVGTETGAKRFRVHPLVERALPPREVADFGTMTEVAELLRKLAGAAEGVDKLALLQEANRNAILARQGRDAVDVGFPDQDATVESCFGLIRSKEPRFEIAEQRIAEILKRDPSNSDGWLLKLELLRRQDAKPETWKEALDTAIEQAPVPEVFHEGVAHLLARNARGQAIRLLERAVEVHPDQSRLRCRLAALLQRQGRRPEAIEHLKTAMEQDPMLPDAYGLLGMLRREEGATAIDDAETLLREAVRLAPGDVVQTSRLIWLLLDIHKGVPERRTAVDEEIRALLDAMLEADKDSWEAHLTYASALREMGGDLERASWFLGKSKKLAPPRKSLEERFALESALIDLAKGKLDDAEGRLRKLSRSDPSNHRIFAGLSKVLEARGQLFAAHAELLRAIERVSPHALDRHVYDLDLQRLQKLIEAAAGVPSLGAPEPITWTEPAESVEPTEGDEPGAEASGSTWDDEPHPAMLDEDGRAREDDTGSENEAETGPAGDAESDAVADPTPEV